MKLTLISIITGLTLICGFYYISPNKLSNPVSNEKYPGSSTAVFAGGCYWCMDAAFEKLSGLTDVISGYAEGESDNSEKTGKVEAIKVIYNPKQISYSELLDYYSRQYDPTDEGGSFHDRGPQYKSYIYYSTNAEKEIAGKLIERLGKIGIFSKPVATQKAKLTNFTPVEESEQHFYKKNPSRYYSYREASGRDNFIKKYWGDIYERKYKKPADEELKKKLTPLQYNVTQKGETERAFQNDYWDNHKEGIYVDIVSGEPLFSSRDKFDAGTGWPSFTKPIDPRFINKNIDRSLAEERVEVKSKQASSHLGHVFNDGPTPTHLRYCLDSSALRFIPKENLQKEGFGNFAWLFK